MQLTIQRDMEDSVCTQGILSVNGAQFCFTLEPPSEAMMSGMKPYRIPAGTYRITLYNSPHFGFVVPLLQDVPGFEDIEIHIGNSAKDTHGCTLVAETRTKDWQSNSRIVFTELMKALNAVPYGEGITATYKDSQEV